MNTNIEKITKYSLIFLSLLTIIGAFFYRVFRLDCLFVIIVLILAILLFFIILYLLNKYNTTPEKYVFQKKDPNQRKKPLTDYFYAIFYLIIFNASIFILEKSATSEAIISPWQKVPDYFFVLYFILSLLLSFIIIKNKPFSKILITLHYLSAFSIALIVYQIGYGFDPFIHQATEKLISETGAVEPKPFYYLGQYALITILNKITFIPIVYLDKFLVPLLAALTLPIALFLALGKWLENKSVLALTVFFLPILPFTFFIVTTPQNLAYLFLTLALIYGLQCKTRLDLINIVLLSLAAFAVHPIAGIPAILFAALITIYQGKQKKYQNTLYRIIFFLMASALPLAFMLFQLGADSNQTNAQNSLTSAVAIPSIQIPNQENAILNTVYLFIFNFKIIYFLLALAGFVIIMKHKKECRILFLYLFSSLALLVSYYLSSRLSFGFLIDYEQNDYSQRILSIAHIFLLPLAILALHGFLIKLFEQNRIVKTTFIVFFCGLLCVSLYGSYPRLDNYHNSHGFSVSQNDIETVNWIDNDAKGDYIVLANQQVSAASLREFGFKKYYKSDKKGSEEIFYYPIPTGGPLYRLYLDMVYQKPSRTTVHSALKLTGADTGYFVLNKYWWAFSKIAAEAKLEADSWHEIGGGEVIVFKYVLGN